MQPFTKLTAVAVPLDLSDVNTDMIIPARFLRKPLDARYGSYLFHDLRHDEDGRLRDSFVLNEAVYRDAQILVAGANFGCGSSRESAVYTLMGYGFRCVIAPSFGDIFVGNCLQNGVLPVVLPEAECAALRAWLDANPGATVTADLEAQTVTTPDGRIRTFALDPVRRERLLRGLDEIGLTLTRLPGIEAFEARYARARPWLARE
ncbi:MAG: 3-isopropylmalate dehydratase small subunit [Proteobacteria bacterium]|nr:3-isopropylmalate dehydratase small subunit [Burkholderiales bacterium]